VRLTRASVLARAAILVVGGGTMLERAWEARRAIGRPGADVALLGRLAVVECLLGVVALVAAAAILLLALRGARPRRSGPTFRVRPAGVTSRGPPVAGPPTGVAGRHSRESTQ
jgi:hypothetical protein